MLHAIEFELSRPPGSSPLLTFESDEDVATFTRLQRMLDKETDFAFDDTPLHEVATWLSKHFEEDVLLDGESLVSEGIALDIPVTVHGRLPTRTVLRNVLKPRGLTADLRDGAVQIQATDETPMKHGLGIVRLRCPCFIRVFSVAKNWLIAAKPRRTTSVRFLVG